jgi:hypothetical protein
MLESLLHVTGSIVPCCETTSWSLGAVSLSPVPAEGDFVSTSFSGCDFDGAGLEPAAPHVAGAASPFGAALDVSSELWLLLLLLLLQLLLQLLVALAAFFSSSIGSDFIAAPVGAGVDPYVAGAAALLETSLGVGSESFPLDGALITALLGVSG